jgi:ATP-binding cassette, subfamily C (CFTR/MRP), member 1
LYADQILILTDKGKVREYGTPDQLKHILGLEETELRWSSEFKTGPAGETPRADAQPIEAVFTTMEDKADAARRLGDPATYKFYAKAAGWFTLTTFAISMAVFAFSQSFPCKSHVETALLMLISPFH